MIPGPIRTERLTLLPLEVAHADEMAAVLADPALYVFTGGEPPTPAALRVRYARQVAGPPDPGTDWLNWVVRVATAGDAGDARGPLAGYVQATVTAGRSAEVAWVVGVAWQGRGIAREAALGMARWLAGHGTRELTAHIHPDHHASAAVARALGLTPAGAPDADGEVPWTGQTVDSGDH
ncbi:GNAT family N-acetyltransferase [Streptomyces sp. NPDC050400]|uniref:GNAT family N-acetyltransferase n=1 Tax=Streptomyces sp. NPDC050400 TaxID=3365610 RepID=UPI0037A0B6D3